ncbi:MAG: hypothetical protein H7X97_14390 [Opitutaceae bacterium]|nr:hypothetical protein [Verrucomicrobiales bacterium]
MSAHTGSGVDRQIGPWGDLEISDITIERPDEYIGPIEVPAGAGGWFFGASHGRDQILSLFKSVDLSESQRRELADVSRWEVETNGIWIAPGQKLLLGLDPRTRAAIYGVLARFPDNPNHATPHMFPKARLADWFLHSGLSAETMFMVKSLLYERGQMMCFSDLQILRDIRTDDEKLRLIKTLSRTPAVLAGLRVAPGTNIEALTGYWGRFGRTGSIRSLLASLSQKPEGGTIDISNLLPPFARERLNTYPDVPPDESLTSPDCFWTALNFLRDPPDDRMLDSTYRMGILKSDFEATKGPPQLGDLLVFFDSKNAPFHSCVYVAGKLVFTKNGANVFSPWILMRDSDVIAIYSTALTPRVLLFRPNNPKHS